MTDMFWIWMGRCASNFVILISTSNLRRTMLEFKKCSVYNVILPANHVYKADLTAVYRATVVFICWIALQTQGVVHLKYLNKFKAIKYMFLVLRMILVFQAGKILLFFSTMDYWLMTSSQRYFKLIYIAKIKLG